MKEKTYRNKVRWENKEWERNNNNRYEIIRDGIEIMAREKRDKD